MLSCRSKRHVITLNCQYDTKYSSILYTFNITRRYASTGGKRVILYYLHDNKEH